MTTSTQPTLEPAQILRTASGFMAAKHLFTAAEHGLFAALAPDGAGLGEIAARTGLALDAARITADAMVAIGLVERDGDHYANGPEAAVFLAGAPGPDLRPLLRFWDRLSYPGWMGLAGALAGAQRPVHEFDDEQTRIFAEGVEAITAPPAHALPDAHDWASRSRVLDVGGGTGSFLLALLDRHPHLSGTLVELPAVAAVARERLAGRAEVVVADALTDPLPEGHDAFVVANLVHLLGTDGSRALLERLRKVAAPGAHVLLVDFWTDPTHSDPPIAALMAGEFRLLSPVGDVFSLDEARAWLDATGWTFAGHRPLAGPQSLVTGTLV